MQTLTQRRPDLFPLDRERAWPLDARMAMFVLEAGGHGPQFVRDRAEERQSCRIIGTVCDSDRASLKHSIVYVRDVTPRHMGFICQSPLPVGTTVWLNCSDENGQSIRTPCRVGRARQFMSGWTEGVLDLE